MQGVQTKPHPSKKTNIKRKGEKLKLVQTVNIRTGTVY